MQNDRCNILKEKFSEVYNIMVKEYWLKGCMSYFLEQHPTMNNERLFQLAVEQWHMSDIAISGRPCLPEQFKSSELFVLVGKYSLQIQSVLEITQPCYDQWRNMHNKRLDSAIEVCDTSSATTLKKRMILLKLFDGVNKVNAIENNAISFLNTKLTPGIKVLIKGPVKCVNKIILLESNNIEILGGEVDTLQIPNAYENILLQNLKKPINPNPKVDYNEIDVKCLQNQNTMSHSIDTIYEDDFLSSVNLDEIDNIINQNQNSKQQTPSSSSLHTSEDVVKDALKQNVLSTNESLSNQNNNENKSISNMFDDEFEILLAMNDIVKNEANAFSTIKQDISKLNPINLYKSNTRTKILPESTKDDVTRLPNKEFNLLSISQILAITDEKKQNNNFVIYAKIESVFERLQLSENKFSLGVILIDKSMQQLKVHMSSEILCNLSGLNVNKVIENRSLIKTNAKMRDEMNKSLSHLKKKLQTIHCYMKIHFSNDMYPTLIELIETITKNI